jgi:hypothetical protein
MENVPDQYSSRFYDLQTQLLPCYHGLHQEFYNFVTFYKLRPWSDSPHKLFIVLFDTLHPEDGHTR